MGGQSDSYTYDWSGQDIAAKRGDELSQLSAQQSKSLVDGDIGASLAQRKRIKDLQGYINAYKFGGPYNGGLGPVVPGRRVASESHSITFK